MTYKCGLYYDVRKSTLTSSKTMKKCAQDKGASMIGVDQAWELQKMMRSQLDEGPDPWGHPVALWEDLPVILNVEGFEQEWQPYN